MDNNLTKKLGMNVYIQSNLHDKWQDNHAFVSFFYRRKKVVTLYKPLSHSGLFIETQLFLISYYLCLLFKIFAIFFLRKSLE